MSDFISRLKNSKFLAVILSVLIACVLWVYVVNVTDPDISDTIHNVPVVISGRSALKDRGLVVTELSSDDLDIRLTGKRNALFNLNSENITVTVDVSDITATGTYDLLCNVTLPLSATGGDVTVSNRENHWITVKAEKRASKTLIISGYLSGSVAKGYQGGVFSVSPSIVEVSGPESLIKTLKTARVDLTEDNLRETFTGALPIELITSDNKVIDIDQVESKITAAQVVYPVSMLKEVPLSVELIAGGGAMPEDVVCEIYPASILLSGNEEDLATMKSLSLGEIDLAEIWGDTVVHLPIQLPEGIVNESGTAEAKVSMQFEDLVKKTFEVTRFELRNVPEGFAAGMISGSVPVTVRGPAEAMEDVKASHLQIEVDLADTEPTEGEIEVLARVVLEEDLGVGVVGTSHTAWVALTK